MRHRLNNRYSRRNFKRTASKVHRKNLGRKIYRGGFRL